ncbi:hypothetical protein [Moorena sp. SIO3I6]|uniref:hypothetical protein n=1 Tax=Moorena sp. SIO3I6 TaxID=2607831 RepID=UPI0013FC9BD5|nr:hypothetical protein [Moorena sp. SIO3I6]NEP23721.1 hypothetical protein [Moorena sp. SIO3I6]
MNTTANNSGTTVPSEPKQLVAVKCRVPLASIKQWIESKETKNFLHVIKHQNGLPLTLTCEDFYYYDKGCGVLYLYDHSQLHLTFKAWQDIVYKELQLGLVPVDFGSVTNEQTIEWLKSERTKKAIQGIKDRHGEGDRNYLVGTRNKDTGKFLLHPELIPTFKADFGIETKPTTEPVVTLPTEVTSQKITPQHTTLVTSQTSVEPEESAQVTFLPEVPDNYHLVNEKLLKEEIRSLRDRLSCGEITEADIITDAVFRGRFKSEISRSHKGLLKEIATSGEKAYIFNRKTQTLWCHPRLAEAFLNPVPVDEEEIPFIQTEVIPREERKITEADLTDPDNVELKNAVLEATGLLEPAKKEMERLHSIEENLKDQLRRVNQKDAETGESPLSLTGSAAPVSEPTFVRLNEVLQQHSLTRGQFLDFVKSDKGTKSQSAIATNLGIEPSDVVNWIDRNNPFVCQEYCNTFVVWAEAAAKTIQRRYWDLEDLTATFFLSDGEFEQFNGLKSSVALRKQIIGTEGIEAVVHYGDKAKLHPDYRNAFVKWIKDPWPDMPGHYLLIQEHFEIAWSKAEYIESHEELLTEMEQEGEPGETILARARTSKPSMELIQEFTEYCEAEAGETLEALTKKGAFTYGWKDGLFWCHPRLHKRFDRQYDQAASMSLLESVKECSQDLGRFLNYLSTDVAMEKAEWIAEGWGLEMTEVLDLSDPDDPRVDGHLFDYFLMMARREDNPLPDYIPYHQVLRDAGVTFEVLLGFECDFLSRTKLNREAEKYGLRADDLIRRKQTDTGEESVKEYHPAFVKVFREIVLGEGEEEDSLSKVARQEVAKKASELNPRMFESATDVTLQARSDLVSRTFERATDVTPTLELKTDTPDITLEVSSVSDGPPEPIDKLDKKVNSKDYLSVRQICEVVNDLLRDKGSSFQAKARDINQALVELGYQKREGRKWSVLPAGRHLRRGNQWLNTVCNELAQRLSVIYLTAKELLEKIKTSLGLTDISVNMLSKVLVELGLQQRLESTSESEKTYKYWGIGQGATSEDGTELVKACGTRRVVYHPDCVDLLTNKDNRPRFQKGKVAKKARQSDHLADRCLVLLTLGMVSLFPFSEVISEPVTEAIPESVTDSSEVRIETVAAAAVQPPAYSSGVRDLGLTTKADVTINPHITGWAVPGDYSFLDACFYEAIPLRLYKNDVLRWIKEDWDTIATIMDDLLSGGYTCGEEHDGAPFTLSDCVGFWEVPFEQDCKYESIIMLPMFLRRFEEWMGDTPVLLHDYDQNHRTSWRNGSVPYYPTENTGEVFDWWLDETKGQARVRKEMENDPECELSVNYYEHFCTFDAATNQLILTRDQRKELGLEFNLGDKPKDSSQPESEPVAEARTTEPVEAAKVNPADLTVQELRQRLAKKKKTLTVQQWWDLYISQFADDKKTLNDINETVEDMTTKELGEWLAEAEQMEIDDIELGIVEEQLKFSELTGLPGCESMAKAVCSDSLANTFRLQTLGGWKALNAHISVAGINDEIATAKLKSEFTQKTTAPATESYARVFCDKKAIENLTFETAEDWRIAVDNIAYKLDAIA